MHSTEMAAGRLCLGATLQEHKARAERALGALWASESFHSHLHAVPQGLRRALSTGHKPGGHTHKHHEAFHRQNTCLRSTTVLPRRRKLNCAMVTNSCHHLYSSFNSQAWLIETTNRRAKKTLINQHCFLDLSSPLQRVRAVK